MCIKSAEGLYAVFIGSHGVLVQWSTTYKALWIAHKALTVMTRRKLLSYSSIRTTSKLDI